MFFAPDKNAVPDFDLELRYLLNANAASLYEGYVLKKFQIFDEAESYIARKRTVFPIDYGDLSNMENVQPNIQSMESVEHITLSDDESDNDDGTNQENVSYAMENFQLTLKPNDPVNDFLPQNLCYISF